MDEMGYSDIQKMDPHQLEKLNDNTTIIEELPTNIEDDGPHKDVITSTLNITTEEKTEVVFDHNPDLPNKVILVQSDNIHHIEEMLHTGTEEEDSHIVLKEAQSLIDDDIGLTLGDLVELRDEATKLNTNGTTVEIDAETKITELEAYLDQASTMKEYMKSIVTEINTGSTVSCTILLSKLGRIVGKYRKLIEELHEIRTELIVSTRTVFKGVTETTSVINNIYSTIKQLDTFFDRSLTTERSSSGQGKVLCSYMKKQMQTAANDSRKFAGIVGDDHKMDVDEIKNNNMDQDTNMVKLGESFNAHNITQSTSRLSNLLDRMKSVVNILDDGMYSSLTR